LLDAGGSLARRGRAHVHLQRRKPVSDDRVDPQGLHEVNAGLLSFLHEPAGRSAFHLHFPRLAALGLPAPTLIHEFVHRFVQNTQRRLVVDVFLHKVGMGRREQQKALKPVAVVAVHGGGSRRRRSFLPGGRIVQNQLQPAERVGVDELFDEAFRHHSVRPFGEFGMVAQQGFAQGRVRQPLGPGLDDGQGVVAWSAGKIQRVRVHFPFGSESRLRLLRRLARLGHKALHRLHGRAKLALEVRKGVIQPGRQRRTGLETALRIDFLLPVAGVYQSVFLLQVRPPQGVVLRRGGTGEDEQKKNDEENDGVQADSFALRVGQQNSR